MYPRDFLCYIVKSGLLPRPAGGSPPGVRALRRHYFFSSAVQMPDKSLRFFSPREVQSTYLSFLRTCNIVASFPRDFHKIDLEGSELSVPVSVVLILWYGGHAWISKPGRYPILLLRLLYILRGLCRPWPSFLAEVLKFALTLMNQQSSPRIGHHGWSALCSR